MMGLSQGFILGNVGREPELRYASGGSAVCNFTVAVNHKQRDQEFVNWWRVVLFGAVAENADRLITKGAPILVEGEIKLTYYTRQDGSDGHQLEIVGGNFRLVGARDDSAHQSAQAGANASADEDDLDLDDVPF